MDETASLADRLHWFDRAAPFASRLATGVGSGIALPRADAVPVGPARLAEQTRTASAQPGRVLGCALFAAREMGGRDVSRPAIWHTNAEEESRLHFRGRADSQLGHRRKQRNLQRRECCVAAFAALPGP